MKKIIPFILLLMVLFGCQLDKNKRAEHIAETSKQLQYSLDTLTIVPAEVAIEVEELIKKSDEFITKYPDDSLSPLFLYDMGKKYLSLHKYEESMKAFDRLVDEYPDHRFAPESLYATGVIYEKNFANFDYARQRYEIFLERYPDHPLAEGLDMVIEYLGNDFKLLEAIKEKSKQVQEEQLPEEFK